MFDSIQATQKQIQKKSKINWHLLKRIYYQGAKRVIEPQPLRLSGPINGKEQLSDNNPQYEINTIFQEIFAHYENLFKKYKEDLQQRFLSLLTKVNTIEKNTECLENIKNVNKRAKISYFGLSEDSATKQKLARQKSFIHIEQESNEQSLLENNEETEQKVKYMYQQDQILETPRSYKMTIETKANKSNKSSISSIKYIQNVHHLEQKPKQSIDNTKHHDNKHLQQQIHRLGSEVQYLKQSLEDIHHLKVANFHIPIRHKHDMRLDLSMSKGKSITKNDEVSHLNNQNRQLREQINKLREMLRRTRNQLIKVKQLLKHSPKQYQLN